MASRLYVGGLPYETEDDDLRKMFDPWGTVASAVVAIDKGSGRSKGFGFVQMSSDEEARSAIESLNGTVVGERAIKVQIANLPKSRREQRL